MRCLGFREYLPPELQSYLITSFRYPEHPSWSFERFYALLEEEGYVIYPGKVGNAACFRIGSMGRLFPGDVRALLSAAERALAQMGVEIRS
jgi:2-aminoethylphosphonate-pyruvate transaminase